MSNYIGKCKTKGCGHATLVAAENVQDLDSNRRTDDVLIGRDGAAYDRDRPFILNGVCVSARCPDHGVYRLNVVNGRYSEKHSCDARCTGATGPSCDCQCGGANHGAAHAA